MAYAGSGMFLYLCLLVMTSVAGAKPIAQFLYEDHIGRTCERPSTSEVENLSACLKSQPQELKSTLDQVAEHLVIGSIASCENTRLTCLSSKVTFLQNDTGALNQALEASCANLPLLADAIRNQEFLAKSMKSYESINDRTLRAVPQDEYERNTQLIGDLKGKLARYKDIEDTVRLTDPLLSSPIVFSAMKRKLQTGFIFSAESPNDACGYLKRHATQLLKQESDDITSSQTAISAKLSDPSSWNESFKRRLWSSSCRDEILAKAWQIPEFQTSTYCRLEGRYGESADIRDRMYEVLLTGMFVEIGLVGKLGETAFHSERALALLSRLTKTATLALGTGAAIRETLVDCQKNIPAQSGGESCESKAPEKQRALFYRKLAVGHCVSNASMAVLALGLPALAVRPGAIAGERALAAEVTERTKETERLIQRVKFPSGPTVNGTMSAQQIMEKNAFSARRRIADYDEVTSSAFSTELRDTDAVVIDMGAGDATALKQAATVTRAKELVAVSYRRPLGTTIPDALSSRVRYIDGDYVENLFLDGKLDQYIGKVGLISDIYGPLSYSKDLSSLFEIYFKLLKKDGKIVFNIADSMGASGEYPVNIFKDENGSPIPGGLAQWLKSIPGLEVKVSNAVIPAGSDGNEYITAFTVTKKMDNIKLPGNLKTVVYGDGAPPHREFAIGAPSQ